MLTIYTPMAGGLAEEALNGLALLMGTSTFHSALNIVMTLGVGGMGYQYVTGAKIKSLLRFVVVTFGILFILLGVKLPVAIIDMQDPMAAHVVDDVPAGVALPAGLVSQLGYGVSKLFDDVFHMPDEKGYNETGMIFGSRIALASSAADFGTSPQLSQDLSSYMRQCIWIAQVQVTKNLTVSQIVQSPELMNVLFQNPSPVYRVILSQAGNVDCIKAAALLKKQLINAAVTESQRLANSLTHGNRVQFDARLSAAQNLFLGVSKTASELLIQNMLMNKVKNSVADAMAFTGNTAGMMNYANTTAMNNLRIAEANTFWMAGYRLPMLNACLWILILCLFPIVILLGFLPVFHKAFASFVMTMVWLWTWPPMFTLLSFFVSYYASIETNIFGQQSGGITLSNVHSLNRIHSDMAFTAGFLAMAIPFIAKGITSGFAEAFNSAAQYLGSMTHGASQGVAGQLSHGNVSVAQFSGWNANYDNTNAHKHDVNQTDYRGMSTHQLANGATVTQTASGFEVINTGTALSSMAVNVNNAQAVSAQLSRQAQASQNFADSLRNSYVDSVQSGMRSAETFNSADSNDYRAGSGQSATDTYGINENYRRAYDEVKQWNATHDKNLHISASKAMSAHFDSKANILGSMATAATGASIAYDAQESKSAGFSDTLRNFEQSQYGQAFNKEISQAISSAQTHHLDASTTHNLSYAEQSAADFAKAQSYSQQASDEYTQAKHYSRAANLAESNSQSINSNLNNQFEQWAIQHKGQDAVSVLSSTDSQHIDQAQTWANEFYSSQQGQTAIQQQAEQLVSQVKSGSTLSAIESVTHADQQEADIQHTYQTQAQQVTTKGQQVHTLNKQQLARVQHLAEQARRADMMKQSSVVQAESTDRLGRGRKDLKQAMLKTMKKVDS